ncbi:hypothetical protein RND81_08G091600 [Saponaria officinalis]|uniref:Protein kinase domain-containing protein n=1 Tax=Saponaria officinalis TaxID=3572 RepID=A0AAW1J5F5_SAPOF
MAITRLTTPTQHAKPFTIQGSQSSVSRGSRLSVNSKKRVMGDFQHLFGAVKKDWEFLKKGVGKALDLANEVLPVPKIVKTVDDFVWVRHFEDPNFTAFQTPSWPQPSYPALSGMDLLLADIEALSTYANYFYSMSKLWSRPLPEFYNAQEITDYFKCRPHIVALRMLEVFSTFSSAAIKVRASRMKAFNSGTDVEIQESASQFEFGKVLKDSFLNLGPTFIKVGQSLSTRPDIIGSEISKALSELHDQIPPFPTTVAMKIIEKELGSPLSKTFSYISEEPIGAASFGQVYRGTTCDGRAVAIKVQRPNLHHLVARDIFILRLGLGWLQKFTRRKNDIRLYADELGKGLMGELDYRLEAENALRFLAHSSFPFIHVPKVFRHLTRKRVLTMEWVVGENPNDLLLISTGASDNLHPAYSEKQKFEAKQRLLDLVSKGVEASLIQLLETGYLHADPHPGNLRYTSSGQIGFLDFGLMCQMEKKHQFAMLASIIHIVNGDWASLVQALSEMDVVKPGTNTHVVTMELENALGEVQFNDGIPDVKFSKVLGKIWSVALKYHFRMPPYFTLLLRSLASLEGLAIAADKNFKTFEAAYPYVVRKLLTDNSYASKKILHSVIFDRRREFQWQRLALFLRVGAARRCLPNMAESAHDRPSESSGGKADKFDVTTFVLSLLPSNDGRVLRRLLVTADGSSLVRAFLSEGATPIRRQLCRAIADVLKQWMGDIIIRKDISVAASSQSSASTRNYQLLLIDRRLRVVFKKIINDARRDWLLMLRFCWVSVLMLVTAAAMACHQTVISLSKTYLGGRISFSPMRVMASS